MPNLNVLVILGSLLLVSGIMLIFRMSDIKLPSPATIEDQYDIQRGDIQIFLYWLRKRKFLSCPLRADDGHLCSGAANGATDRKQPLSRWGQTMPDAFGGQ
jgi:hypothetical protein